MDRMETKDWAVIFVIALIGFSFWWLNKSWTTEVAINAEEISYEMPRPKAVGAEYDISGRKMVYNLTEAERRAKAIEKGLVPAPIQDPKTKAQQAAKLAADAKKKKDAKKTAENARRKAQLGVRVSDGSTVRDAGLTMNFIPDAKNPTSPGPQQTVDNNNKEEPLPTIKDDDPTKTADQWRALLFNAPKVLKNGVDFYKALQAKEISDDEFYKITGDLLSDTGVDRQKLALFIFKMDSSVRTFTVLVSHYTEQAPQDLRTQIYAILKTYGELPRFSILESLFNSRSSRVVVMASEVLGATIAAQQTVQKEGAGRSPGAAPIPVEKFANFRQILNRLVEFGDPAAATAAKTLLTSIDALMTGRRTA